MRRLPVISWAIVLWSVVFAVVRAAAEPTPTDVQWIVVPAPAFRASVEPLCDYRRSEGLNVVVMDAGRFSPEDEVDGKQAKALRDRLREACRAWEGPSYVLLVGAPTLHDVEQPEQRVVPALPGTEGRMTGRPTDNSYGCLDDELLPTVAVGRFPARTVEQADAMVAKTLAWEKDRRPGAWKRQLTVFAGAPLFNPVVDKMVERLAMSHFAALDPSWTARAIYHNPSSAFCLPDASLRPRAIDYLTRGQALTIFIGHSRASGIWDVRLDRRDWGTIRIETGPGIFATFGCYGCQLGGNSREGYGLHAMRNRYGPVAVIGANGSDAAAMAMLFSEGLLKHLPAVRESPRLGNVWLTMKKHLANAPIDPLVFYALDRVDGDPETPQATQRLSHLEMFMLLGDPAIRFPSMLANVSMDVGGKPEAGGTFTVSARVGPGLARARGRLSLERTITSQAIGLEPLPPETEPEERARVLLANHERANRFELAGVDVRIKDLRIEAQLEIPTEIPCPALIVRLHLATDKTEGMATRLITIEREKEAP